MRRSIQSRKSIFTRNVFDVFTRGVLRLRDNKLRECKILIRFTLAARDTQNEPTRGGMKKKIISGGEKSLVILIKLDKVVSMSHWMKVKFYTSHRQLAFTALIKFFQKTGFVYTVSWKKRKIQLFFSVPPQP